MTLGPVLLIRALAFAAMVVALLTSCSSQPATGARAQPARRARAVHSTTPDSVSIPSPKADLQLPGYWFPASVGEPRPAVIYLHGCGGLLGERGRLTTKQLRVSHYFNLEHMHMLLVDSFTPRGEKSICETPVSQRRIQHEDRREDAFAAIQW